MTRVSPAMCVINIRFLNQHLGTGDLSSFAVCMSDFRASG